jgi:hypothetical protein
VAATEPARIAELQSQPATPPAAEPHVIRQTAQHAEQQVISHTSEEAQQQTHAPRHEAPLPKQQQPTSEEQEAATPLGETARKFLQPLVGIDPQEVTFRTDEHAEQLTTQYQADALTVDQQVLLRPDQVRDDAEPRTLGLLAHELTHVKQQKEPGFVPPVVQQSSGDDEAVALEVERTVKEHAATHNQHRGQETFDPSPAQIDDTTQVRKPWGGLPAPWEPLPDWLTNPDHEEESNSEPAFTPARDPGTRNGKTNGVHAAAPPPSTHVVSDIGSAAASLAMYAAEHDRDTTGQPQTPQQQQSDDHDKGAAVEPDLDALAQQVYTVLKRRLLAERQRFG